MADLSIAAAEEAQGRRRQMLRTAFGPTIAAALADPAVIEVMVNPDGKLWIERASVGRDACWGTIDKIIVCLRSRGLCLGDSASRCFGFLVAILPGSPTNTINNLDQFIAWSREVRCCRLKRLLKKSEKLIPRGLKPARNVKNKGLNGTAEAVPFQNRAEREFFSNL